MSQILLAADAVGLRYGPSVAVDCVDLTVAAGEAVAIVGPSGSGKSSLMYCMAGLTTPTSGVVRLRGKPISTMDGEGRAAVRRENFGFVFQFADLVPELTLLENTMLPCEILGASRQDAKARAEEVLDRLGIADLGGRRPSQVSGGQRQRAAVGRAVVHRPGVVFADEPTGALDSESSALVLGELLALGEDHGAAVIVVTHDAAIAARCDRHVCIRDGAVAGASISR